MAQVITHHQVSLEFDGKAYRAHYTVESGVVTVSWIDKPGVTRKLQRIVKASPDVAAHGLFREILTDAKARGHL